MSVLRKKPYKALPPQETISKIKDILSCKLGVSANEVSLKQENAQFFSAHLELQADWIPTFDISTNGKGLTPEYSLASGYGELMERIQSGILLKYREFATELFIKDNACDNSYIYKQLKKSECLLKYIKAPDEEVIYNQNAIKDAIGKYVRTFDNERVIEKLRETYEIFLPFYSVMDSSLVKLPMRVIEHCCGSNGMCAGNTPEEAILQGICEIMERYVLRIIYNKNLTLPTIPKEEFRGNDIYDKILLLEKQLSIDIEVKDCSCGVGIPAVGVLILDNDKTKYQFHIGVDPSPITALERAISELYQGKSELNMHPIDVSFQTMLLFDTVAKDNERIQYSWGKNRFPVSILMDRPSYEFSGFDLRWGESDERDLTLFKQLIEKLNHTLYIRDVSYLGFPSYIVYIPGMSELINVNSMKWLDASFLNDSKITLLSHKIPSSSSADIEKLLRMLSMFNSPEYVSFLGCYDAWNRENPDAIVGLLFYKIGDLNNATKYMKRAIAQTKEGENYLLFKCCYDIMLSMIQEFSSVNTIQHIYPKEVFDTAYSILVNDTWIKQFNLSDCFGTSQSGGRGEDEFIEYSQLLKKLEDLYVANTPDQSLLSNLFYE